MQPTSTVTVPAQIGSERKFEGIIDVHSHAIVAIGEQAPMSPQPRWSAEAMLELMDTHGVATALISLPNVAAGNDACALARQMNEWLANLVSRYPGRFGAMASLPQGSPDDVLNELAYALDTLHLDGVFTPSSINDVYLGDSTFDPWFEEMDRRGVTLFIHPAAAKASHPLYLGLNVSLLEFMFDSTRMLTNMVFSGAKKRFARIKMISTHGGGTLPYLVTRLQTLAQVFGSGEGRAQLSEDEIREGLASFYYDLTAATSSAQLHAIQQLVPASQLLMGFDHPFMPERSIRPAIDDVRQWAGFDDSDLPLIANGNASLLYPRLSRLAP